MLVLVALALIAAAALAVRLAPLVAELRRVRRMTSGVTTPPMYPVIGHAIEVAGVGLDQLYAKLQEVSAEFGPMFRLVLGHVTVLFVMDPDDMEAVMTSDKTMDKSFVYSPLEPLMGRGISTLTGDEWRRHRKAVTPSLHPDLLREFVPIFYKQGAALADVLEAHNGEVVDVRPLCANCAGASVCESVMSTEADENDEEMRAVGGTIDKALDHFMYRVCRPWFLSDWAYSLHRRRYAEYAEIRDFGDRLTRRIIGEKRAAMKSDASGAPQRKRLAFLDHALTSPEASGLTDDELVEEVKTLVSVGSGSLKDVLAFIIYTLAIRQDIQDKVRQELNDILGEGGRAVEHSDLAHMQYTERVIKETLRYFSVVPLFARNTKEDLTLPSGLTVPRGCQIVFWLPYTHRNPKWFPEPDKFDPDRFLPENSRGRHPFAYLPFSGGPRNCIAQRYAMILTKTVVAALVPRLRFELPDDGPRRLEDVPIVMDLTIQVRGGPRVRALRC